MLGILLEDGRTLEAERLLADLLNPRVTHHGRVGFDRMRDDLLEQFAGAVEEGDHGIVSHVYSLNRLLVLIFLIEVEEQHR